MNKERARLDVANAANELIIVALRERIFELEGLLKKFRPCDENGDGWDFIYDEGSEHLGEAVLEALKEPKP
jgi:hypothetical protein